MLKIAIITIFLNDLEILCLLPLVNNRRHKSIKAVANIIHSYYVRHDQSQAHNKEAIRIIIIPFLLL